MARPSYLFDMDLGPNETEMFALLDLINAEWQSDPQSVACFDLRLVAKVKAMVEKNRANAKPTIKFMTENGRNPYDLTK
jgi:hypothetical protein